MSFSKSDANILSLKKTGNLRSFRGCSSIVGTTLSTAWEEGTIYQFPSVASQMTVSSDNANDNSSGTGARLIVIFYLDENYLQQFEVVQLNGTTPVNTVATNILRINSQELFLAGSNSTNIGNIFVGIGAITAGKPDTVFSRISTGLGISYDGVVSTPVNSKISFLRFMATTPATKAVEFQFSCSNFFGNQELAIPFFGKDLINYTEINTEGFGIFPEKADIRINVKVASGSSDFCFVFNYINFSNS